jgi:aminopeptidase-like protein
MESVGMTPTGFAAGRQMAALCQELFPICRSITGPGVRETLRHLQQHIDVQMLEVPSRTQVFDWEVPDEWSIREAYIEDPTGRRVVDFADNNLHVVSYSAPVRAEVSLEELQAHLHSLPEHPEWIPYRTSYYERSWGFCLQHRVRESLKPGTYTVVIDSTLEQGNLNYGELVIPGVSDREMLISTHICHPSLANDNLSGIAVATFLARHFETLEHPPAYTLRFLFIPGTIGSITWLARNENRLDRVVGGIVLTGIGDSGHLRYKRSRRQHSLVDQVVEQVLAAKCSVYECFDYVPYGYDERQFCSPGIDLAVGCMMRTPFGQYPQYHTSADDLSLLNEDSLGEALEVCVAVVSGLSQVRRYRNLSPKGEPQLGRRGLYEAIGGDNDKRQSQMALLWMLSYSDGRHTTFDIGRKSGLDLSELERAAGRLIDAGLLEQMGIDE